ncbi:MAG TPA: PA2779 family protein [Vicinamibacterales bacterium]|nr:PA2779 family protein [Vicinamibacterales bacterium]
MYMIRRVLATVLAVMLCAPSAGAQQTHVISTAALEQAVQQRVSQDQIDRQTIRAFLQNPAVRDVAAKAGLSLERAEAAVSTLQGDELHRAAGQARQVNQQLAGGASTIVISTTTIIIVLLIILLIVLVAK